MLDSPTKWAYIPWDKLVDMGWFIHRFKNPVMAWQRSNKDEAIDPQSGGGGVLKKQERVQWGSPTSIGVDDSVEVIEEKWDRMVRKGCSPLFFGLRTGSRKGGKEVKKCGGRLHLKAKNEIAEVGLFYFRRRGPRGTRKVHVGLV